jgi:hypothetical protein
MFFSLLISAYISIVVLVSVSPFLKNSSMLSRVNLGIFKKITSQYSSIFDLLFFLYALSIFSSKLSSKLVKFSADSGHENLIVQNIYDEIVDNQNAAGSEVEELRLLSMK